MSRVAAGVCVEIRTVLGSAPREAGALMLVRRDGIEGTIGGGRLEFVAIERARGLLEAWRADGAPEEITETHALGPHLGQCCGGVVILGYRPWFAATLPPAAPRFHLQLHGAGHVGRALVRVLATISCSIEWIDSRADAFPPAPADAAARIERRRVDTPAAWVDRAPPGSLFLVMTHSHALDAAITAAALARGDAAYVGLIGSATKRARFEHRWRREGLSGEAIDLLVCPVGVPGIAGKQPEILAVAIAAQLLACAPAHDAADQRPVPAGAQACGGCAADRLCAAEGR